MEPATETLRQQPIVLDLDTLNKVRDYWVSIPLTSDEINKLGELAPVDPKYKAIVEPDGREVKQIALRMIVTRFAPELFEYLPDVGDRIMPHNDSVTLTPDRLYALEVYLTNAIKAAKTGQVIVWKFNGKLINSVPQDSLDIGGNLVPAAPKVANFKQRTEFLTDFFSNMLGLGKLVERCQARAETELARYSGNNPIHTIELQNPT